MVFSEQREYIFGSTIWISIVSYNLHSFSYCNVFYKTKTAATRSHRLPFILFSHQWKTDQLKSDDCGYLAIEKKVLCLNIIIAFL